MLCDMNISLLETVTAIIYSPYFLMDLCLEIQQLLHRHGNHCRRILIQLKSHSQGDSRESHCRYFLQSAFGQNIRTMRTIHGCFHGQCHGVKECRFGWPVTQNMKPCC